MRGGCQIKTERLQNYQVTYKIIVALAFGLFGFFANFYPLNVSIPPNKASFVWGLVFPMLISLSWGWRWGLLSATLGLGAQTMWILWLPKNGWAPFVAIPFYTFWIVWHGWCLEHKKKGILSSVYSAEVPFRIVYAIVLITIFPWSFKFNPSPWAPQMTVTTAPSAFVNFIQFKVIVEGYIVLLLADVLRNLNVVKKILLLENRDDVKSDFFISGAMLFGLIYWLISGIAHYMFSHHEHTLAENLILELSPEEGIERLLVLFMCLAAGLMLSKYFSKYRESTASLIQSETNYKNLFSSIRDVIIIADKDRNITNSNQPALKEQFGYELEEIRGQKTSILYATQEDFQETGKEVFSSDGKAVGKILETNFKRKDGSVFPSEMYALKLLDENSDTVGNFGIIRDITDRRKAEEHIKGSLREKEILLTEIHHRVKNNMQVISSLIMLHSGQLDDEKVRTHFITLENRIRSMALVHEKLYNSKDMSSINFNEYMHSLIDEIFESNAISMDNIKPSVNIKDIYFGLDKAVPCGLIITELITNSLKHAFPSNQNGEIKIEITKDMQGNYIIIVDDNGIGIPEEIDLTKVESLGFSLLHALVKQLKGEMEVSGKNGTRVAIIFPE